MTEKKVTKEMNIGDIARKYPDSIEVFAKHGMHCIGCAAAHFETLAQGCKAHGIDTDALVEDLNKKIKKSKKPKA